MIDHQPEPNGVRGLCTGIMLCILSAFVSIGIIVVLIKVLGIMLCILSAFVAIGIIVVLIKVL